MDIKDTQSSIPRVSFLGDPRYTVALSMNENDVCNLEENKWLTTNFLDYLIQRSLANNKPIHDSTDVPGQPNFIIGSTNSVALLQSYNQQSDAGKKAKLKASLQFLSSRPHTLLIPNCSHGHFFVVCVTMDVKHQTVFTSIDCYDSMRHPTRGKFKVKKRSPLGELLSELRIFISNFVLHGDANVDPDALLEMAAIKECPQQRNSFDCGLFCLALILHLVAGHEITSYLFCQDEVTNLRVGIARECRQPTTNLDPLHFLPRKFVLQHFSRLMDVSTEIELVGRTPSKNNKNEEEGDNAVIAVVPPMEASGSSTIDNSNTLHGGVATASQAGEVAENKEREHDKDEESDCKMAPSKDAEQVLYECEMMKGMLAQIENTNFNGMDAVAVFIDRYETATGITMLIRRSVLGSYRRYVCCSHVDCQFFIAFGRRRRDGALVVKDSHIWHSGYHRENRAKDGRRWKKRRKGLYMPSIEQIAKVKDGDPVAADLVKTASNVQHEDLTYNQAFRALSNDVKNRQLDAIKSYHLVVPYLNAFTKNNEGSITRHEKDEQGHLHRLFVCPGFMNENLQNLRPVLSLDAAHMGPDSNGTMFTFAASLANNEIYIVAFGFSSTNENEDNWKWMLENIHEACPGLSIEHPDGRVTYRKWVLVSDRDKGLKNAIADVMPLNHATACAVHIQRNVQQLYGSTAARNVISIAKTFSTRREMLLLEETRETSQKAYQYLLNIQEKQWRSTEWMKDETLPPRYGIVSSNLSESTNAMLSEARNLPWLYAMDSILHKMVSRIFKTRNEFKNFIDSDIVANVSHIIQAHWEGVTRSEVIELEEGEDKYSVTTFSGFRNEQATHLLQVEQKHCSCGIWQDTGLPCLEAIAYYKKWEERSFEWVLRNKVSLLHSSGSIKSITQHNVIPVAIDTLTYDYSTLPPIKKSRRAGRPKKKRYRQRSKYIDPSDSPIVCSKCGRNGHNSRTCGRQPLTQQDLDLS